jgi:hypothetical protein
MNEQAKKFFAYAAAQAIDAGYVDLQDACKAFGWESPYGVEQWGPEKAWSTDPNFDWNRWKKECQEMADRVEEEFQKFFGCSTEDTLSIDFLKNL